MLELYKKRTNKTNMLKCANLSVKYIYIIRLFTECYKIYKCYKVTLWCLIEGGARLLFFQFFSLDKLIF